MKVTLTMNGDFMCSLVHWSLREMAANLDENEIVTQLDQVLTSFNFRNNFYAVELQVSAMMTAMFDEPKSRMNHHNNPTYPHQHSDRVDWEVSTEIVAGLGRIHEKLSARYTKEYLEDDPAFKDGGDQSELHPRTLRAYTAWCDYCGIILCYLARLARFRDHKETEMIKAMVEKALQGDKTQ